MGTLCGFSVFLVETILSLARVGAIAHLLQYTRGTSAFDWSYLFSLMLILTVTGAIAGWASSGMGFERVKRSGVKFAAVSAIAVVGGLVVIVAAYGFIVTITRSHSVAPISRTFTYLENETDWIGGIRFTAPEGQEDINLGSIRYANYVGYVFLLVDPATGAQQLHKVANNRKAYASLDDGETWTYDTHPMAANFISGAGAQTLRFESEWAGFWNGKSVTCIEATGNNQDFPLLEAMVDKIPSKPSLNSAGDGRFKMVIWTDAFYNRILCISVLLCKNSGDKPGSGGRLDFIFSYDRDPFRGAPQMAGTPD